MTQARTAKVAGLDWLHGICDPQAPSGIRSAPFTVKVKGRVWACASDGKIIVAVRTPLELPPVPLGGNVAKTVVEFLTEDVGQPILDWPALKRWLGKPAWEWHPCPSCGCSGRKHPKPSKVFGNLLGLVVNKGLLAAVVTHLHSNRVAAKLADGIVKMLYLEAPDQWRVVMAGTPPDREEPVGDFVQQVLEANSFPPPPPPPPAPLTDEPVVDDIPF